MKEVYTKKSTFSKCIEFMLKIINIKKRDESEESVKKFWLKLSRKKDTTPLKMNMKLEKGFSIPIYTLNGDLTNPKSKFLVYIHGGSFTQEAIKLQINFAYLLAKKTNSTLVFPKYTLAPTGNYKKMYKDINEIYSKLLKYDKEINFLGDSAGGGFSLAYSMYLRDNEVKNIKNLILISPWVDLTLNNKELCNYQKSEYLIGIEGTRYSGKVWSLNCADNPLLSPINGNFNNIGTISIAFGGKELLKPDILRLEQKLDENNVKYNSFEISNQIHDCAMFPTKERQYILEKFANIINQ